MHDQGSGRESHVVEDEFDEAGGDDPIEKIEQDDDESGFFAAASGWGVSLALHALICLILVFVVVIGHVIEQTPPTRVARVEPPPPPPEEPKQERTLKEVETEIEIEIEVETPVVTNLDLQVEELETEDEIQTEVSEPKGREEAVASAETGGSGAFMAIGAGGGGAGAFGNRSGGGKKRALGRFGGTKASESAVEAALRWFMRHQSDNGQWDVDAYPINCDLPGPKCEPATFGASVVVNKVKDKQGTFDIAITGYAILCYLGAGYDHKTPNKYRSVVKRGLDWLVKAQSDSGLFGESNYEHPIATMALVEAYGMTNDPALRPVCERAVEQILARQVKHEEYPLGWSYFAPTAERIDSSVTGWNVMALKSAKAAGLDIGDGLEGAKRWLEAVWQVTNPGGESFDPYTGRSGFPYTWNANNDQIVRSNGPEDLTCVGALCAVFLGMGQGEVLLDTLVNTLTEEQMQIKWPLETYYLYYSTLAVFQAGGDSWKRWNETTRDLLVDNQNRDGNCFDGSWAHGTRTSKVWGQRILSTAYCTLSLEVYYRYLPIAVGRH